MNHPSTRSRILSALALRNMTVAELSACLSVGRSAIREQLKNLEAEGEITRYGFEYGNGRPWIRYSLSVRKAA